MQNSAKKHKQTAPVDIGIITLSDKKVKRINRQRMLSALAAKEVYAAAVTTAHISGTKAKKSDTDATTQRRRLKQRKNGNTCVMAIFYTFVGTYLLAINFYAFLLVKNLKDETDGTDNFKKSDGRLFLTGLLGGALTIYICLFVFKYRQKSLFLMILMPLLVVLNVYLAILAIRSGFSFFIVAK